MAQFSVNIPDDQVEVVVGSLCGMYGFDPEGSLTANAFANKVVRDFVRQVVEAYAVRQAESALDAARASVAGISITDPDQVTDDGPSI